MPGFEVERVSGFLYFTAIDYAAAAQACREAAVKSEGENARLYEELAQKLELAARVL